MRIWHRVHADFSRDGLLQHRRRPRKARKADHFHQVTDPEVHGFLWDESKAIGLVHRKIFPSALLDDLSKNFHPLQRAGLRIEQEQIRRPF